MEGLYFHNSLSVCVWVCLSISEQNSSRTDAPICTQFLLNSCLPHWLRPYWNWWPLVEGQGRSDATSISFLHNSLLNSMVWISVLLCLMKMKFNVSLRYALGKFVFEFQKYQMGYNVIMTSFKFYPYNFQYLLFYQT